MKRIITAVAVGGMALLGLYGAGRVAVAQGYNLTWIDDGDTDSYTRFYPQGARIRVAVRGDNRADLDLFVDCPLHGQVIASDTDLTDQCYVEASAPESGVYRIRVVNQGPVGESYAIVVE